MKNEGILCVERMVLESLSQKEKSLHEIVMDTTLNYNVVGNIIFELKVANMINFNGVRYSLNKENRSKWIKHINDKNHIKEEVKELFTSLVNGYFSEEKLSESTKSFKSNSSSKSNLKMKKVWMTEKEDQVYQTLVGNLKSFLDNVQNQRQRDNKSQHISKQKVVIWGDSNYSELINGVLQAI